MMTIRVGVGFCVALAMCSLPALSAGQAAAPSTSQDTEGGIVIGRVVNGNGAKPVVGYTVHLVNKNLAPGVDRTAVTGDDGGYEFDGVRAADKYAVAVYDATGKLVGTDPSFPVAQDSAHTAVPDLDISRGLTAELTVKAGGLIQLDKGISPGSNVGNEQVRLLPLFNRNFLNLGLIQPGVHDVPQGSPLQGAAFSIAGSRATSTYFLLDGVDNVASDTNQAIPFQINEAVREFRVTYANPDLRYGQGSGGIVDVITSSGDFGDNKLHGSLFGYFNNDALNAGTPLSAYANTGFSRAASFANVSSSLANSVIYIDPAYDPTAPGATPPADCSSVSGANNTRYCGYSPQSYNALFSLLSPSTGGSVSASGSCNTTFCAAGAFNPAGLLSGQDSHTQPFTQKQFGGSVGKAVGKRAFLFGSYEGTLIDNATPTFERVPTFLDRAPVATAASADRAIASGLLALYPQANVGQTGNALIANSGAGIFGFYRGLAPNYTHVHGVQFRPDIKLGSLGSVTLRYTGQLLDQLHDDTLPASSAYPGNGANRKAQNQSASLSYNLPFGKKSENANLLTIAFTQYRVDEVAQDRFFNVSSTGLNMSSMPSVIVSGIDPLTTVAGSNVTPGTLGQGYVGGWYDSFWQTCAASSDVASGCGGRGGNSAQSPSPITPSLDGDFPLARLGAPLSAPSKRRDSEAFLSDVLELHLGSKNNLFLGGDYRYQQNYSYDGGLARGLIVSNNIGEFTHDSETCVSCVPRAAFSHPSFDYELRQPIGYTGDLRSNVFGGFVQDQFHLASGLTLVAGARYDYFGQPLDTGNRQWNYSFANQGLNQQGRYGTFDAFAYPCGGGTTFFDAVYGPLRASTPAGKTLCSNGSYQLPTDKTNATGLLGVSFAPGSGRTVVRGAIGAYYDHAPASYNQKLLLNRPSPYNVTNPSAIYGQNFGSQYQSANCQSMTQCAFGLSTLNFSGLTGAQTASFQNYQAASGANVLYARDVNALKTPYLIQISTGVQHQFGKSFAAEVGYVGSIGQRLPLVYDSNFTNEFYCQTNGFCSNNTYFPVFTQSDIGNSNYNSVVAQLSSSQYHGLSFHASYTYAKSLDNVAASDFPNTTDSLFSQLYGRQLYGLGNPAVFALQQSQAGFGSNGFLRGSQLGTQNARTAVLQSANIPSFTAIQSALTTTGSRAINTTSYTLPQNPLAFSSAGATHGADYGPSDFDVRHRAVVDFVYRPAFKAKFARNFVVSGITTVQSGQPFTIFSGPAYGQISQLVNVSSTSPIKMTGNANGYISGITRSNLPSLNSVGCPTLYAQPSLYKASSTPAACVGNSGRNAFTGPAYFSQDAAIQRDMHLKERKTLVLRAEGYNLFNRANYYNPISEVSADGVHLNPEFGQIRSSHDARQFQFAARFDF